MTLNPTLPRTLSLAERLTLLVENIAARPRLPRRTDEEALPSRIKKLLIAAYNMDVPVEDSECVVMDMIAKHFDTLTILGTFTIEDRSGYARWRVTVKTEDGRVLDLTQDS